MLKEPKSSNRKSKRQKLKDKASNMVKQHWKKKQGGKNE